MARWRAEKRLPVRSPAKVMVTSSASTASMDMVIMVTRITASLLGNSVQP